MYCLVSHELTVSKQLFTLFHIKVHSKMKTVLQVKKTVAFLFYFDVIWKMFLV